MGPKTNAADSGVVIVLTGDGKGKTTAALGLAMRAAGAGLKVLILQFIKGDTDYGELHSLDRLAPQIEIRRLGKGFVDPRRISDEDRRCAARQFETAAGCVRAAEHDMIILDEINYLVHFGLLQTRQLVELITTRPPKLHLVLTGRGAPAELLALADTATEMKKIKHGFDAGRPALKGIEF